MLTRLFISNYALIDRLEIDLEGGLTIITGETGAGKSIILGALALILGERADVRSVRDSSQKTVVEATFDLTGYGMGDFFSQHDIDFFEKECIIRREVSTAGRSRAFVNDSPVNTSVLRQLATRLIDIHSQHSNMLLGTQAFQLEVLDSIAADKDLLDRYEKAYAEYRKLQRHYAELSQEFEKNKAEEDYIRFQLAQLEELQLKPGEDETLDEEQNKLANVAESKETLWNAVSVLNGDDGSVIDSLTSVAQSLERAECNLSDIKGLAERVASAAIELKDVASTLSAVNDNLSADPARLEYVESRINDIYALKRKHNVGSVDDLLELQRQYDARIDRINNSDEELRQCQSQLVAAEHHLLALAADVSAKRKAAAKRFVAQLMPVAQSLGMQNLQFDIAFGKCECSRTGCDVVEFLFAFNKKQQLTAVKNSASGGEISRLMLCIKSIIAESMNLPTIIFDEVDTGVSGDIANRIGQLMDVISHRIQVIAITHLPQVAAHARRHLLVYKTDTDSETLTGVRALDFNQHVGEVARMLSGRDIDEAAIENAKSLIRQIDYNDR